MLFFKVATLFSSALDLPLIVLVEAFLENLDFPKVHIKDNTSPIKTLERGRLRRIIYEEHASSVLAPPQFRGNDTPSMWELH